MQCPICTSNDSKSHAHWPDYNVLDCCSCGFRFIDISSAQYPEKAQFVYDEPEIGPIRPELPHIQRRVRNIVRFKQPPGRALDIGCGKGEVALALSEKGFECTGIDMKAPVITHLQEQYPHISWLNASASDLKKFSARFDVITMYHVLEHIADPKNALETVKALANPGALIVIEVPNVGGLKARLKGQRWDYYKVDHVNYFRKSDLRRLATELSLEILAIRGYQHFSYPQDILWKDLIKGALGWIGFQDVISIFLRVR